METAKQQLKNLYDDICEALIGYENNTDWEMTDEEWLDVFYHLLVRVTTEIVCLQE